MPPGVAVILVLLQSWVLLVCLLEVSPERLGFTEDDAGPEQVDIASVSCGGANSVSFEEGDAFGNDAEAAEQVGPKLLGGGFFGMAGHFDFPGVDAFPPGMGEGAVAKLRQ